MRRALVAALALAGCLLVQACAGSGDDSQRDRQGGFYGGTSGGLARP